MRATSETLFSVQDELSFKSKWLGKLLHTKIHWNFKILYCACPIWSSYLFQVINLIDNKKIVTGDDSK